MAYDPYGSYDDQLKRWGLEWGVYAPHPKTTDDVVMWLLVSHPETDGAFTKLIGFTSISKLEAAKRHFEESDSETFEIAPHNLTYRATIDPIVATDFKVTVNGEVVA